MPLAPDPVAELAEATIGLERLGETPGMGQVEPPVLPREELLRVVLGHAPAGAKVHPCLEMTGDLGEVLDDLGARDVLQVLVEGGAGVAGAFHRAGLVDRYVIYLAPALFGGDDAPGLFSGAGAATMSDVWRGRITRVTPLGDDIRVDLKPLEPH